jgi:hypothetical protein
VSILILSCHIVYNFTCNIFVRNILCECTFHILEDLNPSDEERPQRDAAWVEAQWKLIRFDISKVHSAYHNSGNQDAENSHEEWMKSCQLLRMGDHIIYSDLLVIDDQARDGMGKKAKKVHGRDTGITGGGTGQPLDVCIQNSYGRHLYNLFIFIYVWLG